MDNVTGQKGQPQGGSASANLYDTYKNTELWRHVEKAVHDLAKNNDVIELTNRENIVGYICKQIQPLVPESNA